MSEDVARREAQRRFGSPTHLVERGFDIRGSRWWDETVADVRYAVRLLRKQKSFTAVALATIALGTGANVAVYSALHAVILAPLPYTSPDRLIVLRQQQAKAGRDRLDFSVAEMADYRQGTSATLSAVAEYFVDDYIVAHGNDAPPERIQAGIVSANFFELFGVSPVLGRAFAPADERPGASPTVVLSHEYWRRSFGGNRAAIGQLLKLNDRVATVIGVLPPLPPYPDHNDVYLTTTSNAFRMWPERIRNRGRRFASLFGRMKADVSLRHVNANLAATASRLAVDYPEV
jgi:MacB-like periplasmic core domain